MRTNELEEAYTWLISSNNQWQNQYFLWRFKMWRRLASYYRWNQSGYGLYNSHKYKALGIWGKQQGIIHCFGHGSIVPSTRYWPICWIVTFWFMCRSLGNWTCIADPRCATEIELLRTSFSIKLREQYWEINVWFNFRVTVWTQGVANWVKQGRGENCSEYLLVMHALRTCSWLK